MTSLRKIRLALGLSQRELALRIGVPTESYRLWDVGRRAVPSAVLERVSALGHEQATNVPLSIPVLARYLRVSPVTLRTAVHSGRLDISIEVEAGDRRSKAAIRTTKESANRFRETFYARTSRWTPKVEDPFPNAPDDYACRILNLRERLRVSQRELADRIGAKGRAVVYQWESERRRPSRFLWRKLLQLGV